MAYKVVDLFDLVCSFLFRKVHLADSSIRTKTDGLIESGFRRCFKDLRNPKVFYIDSSDQPYSWCYHGLGLLRDVLQSY